MRKGVCLRISIWPDFNFVSILMLDYGGTLTGLFERFGFVRSVCLLAAS